MTKNKTFKFIGISAVFMMMYVWIIGDVGFDSDTWFILSTGREIVERGSIPMINPFSIIEGLDIIIQQWAFDVLFYKIYSFLGYYGIYLYLCVMTIVFIVLFYYLTGLWTDNITKRILGTAAASFIMAYFETGRPYSITIPLIICEIIILEYYKKTGNRKILFLLPILAFLQVNIQSSMYPLLFILMLPYFIPEHLDRKFLKSFNIELIIPALLMIAAGFLNPYGLRGMAYLFLSYSTAASSALGIEELQAPTTADFTGWIVFIAVLILCEYICRNRKETDLQRFCMAAGCIFLASFHRRNIWFLIVAIIPILVELIPEDFHLQNDKFLSTVLFCVAFPSCILISTVEYEFEDSQITPIYAADYLDEIDEDIVLYNEFNNGAYLEWRGYQVYIDARPEIWEDEINCVYDFCSESITVMNGSIDYDEFIEKYGFNYFIVSDDCQFDVYLDLLDDYELVVDGNGYNMYEAVSD